MRVLVPVDGHPRGRCAVNRSDGAAQADKDATGEHALAKQEIDVGNDEDAVTIHNKRIYEAPPPDQDKTVLHVLHGPDADCGPDVVQQGKYEHI